MSHPSAFPTNQVSWLCRQDISHNKKSASRKIPMFDVQELLFPFPISPQPKKQHYLDRRSGKKLFTKGTISLLLVFKLLFSSSKSLANFRQEMPNGGSTRHQEQKETEINLTPALTQGYISLSLLEEIILFLLKQLC